MKHIFTFLFVVYSFLLFGQYEVPYSDNLILKHKYYTVGYDTYHKSPMWSSYMLCKSRLVKAVERSDKFVPDPLLRNEYSSSNNDYKHQQMIDRGHMTPAGDMSFDKVAMKECFYLSNVIPQNSNLNRGMWKNLESAIRNVSRKYDTLYIVTGVMGFDGLMNDRIPIPEVLYKVIALKINGKWSSIGFCFYNKSMSQNDCIKNHAMTVNAIENMLGNKIKFFTNIKCSNFKNTISNQLVDNF